MTRKTSAGKLLASFRDTRAPWSPFSIGGCCCCCCPSRNRETATGATTCRTQHRVSSRLRSGGKRVQSLSHQVSGGGRAARSGKTSCSFQESMSQHLRHLASRPQENLRRGIGFTGLHTEDEASTRFLGTIVCIPPTSACQDEQSPNDSTHPCWTLSACARRCACNVISPPES